MSNKQKTLAKAVKISGQGLHTGAQVNLIVQPAPENHGIKFKRVDIEGQPLIDAYADFVVDTSRGTTIGNQQLTIATIEHLMAAFVGLQIDNAIVEIDAPELPIMDGSAKPYIEALSQIGTVDQEEDKSYFEITEKMEFKDEETGIEIIAYPDDNFSVDVHVDYNSKVVGHQYASFNGATDFAKDIAPCRTFVFLHELEILLKNNLIKGGDLDNAIVIVDRQMSKEELDKLAELFNKPKVDVLPEGILNNIELRFDNEMARHKLLDVVGDLALIGKPIKGKIIANKPGHKANTDFAKTIRQIIKKERNKPKPPAYDPNTEPLFDIQGIKKILPHRPPFLLVDKITFMDEWTVCGIKNVSMNEPFFVGHYPEEAIMPGVLQIEAMAQTGGILLLSGVPDPENYVVYFMKIDNIKFKQKVVPGDTLNIKMVLLEPIKRGIAKTKGQIFVGNTLVMEGEFMAQLAKLPQEEKEQ